MPPAPPRVPERADAQRNRARLLDAAAAAFSAEEDPTLDSIARRAGVGIGTLYRHFPTREALVEAVYDGELTRLCDSATQLLNESAPDVALRIWMGRYAEFVATKRGMADALRALIASGTVSRAQTRPRLTAAIQTMLDAGVRAQSLRDDVRAADVTASLAGVLLATGVPDDPDQAGRMLDLLMDGLRARPAREPRTPAISNRPRAI